MSSRCYFFKQISTLPHLKHPMEIWGSLEYQAIRAGGVSYQRLRARSNMVGTPYTFETFANWNFEIRHWKEEANIVSSISTLGQSSSGLYGLLRGNSEGVQTITSAGLEKTYWMIFEPVKPHAPLDELIRRTEAFRQTSILPSELINLGQRKRMVT